MYEKMMMTEGDVSILESFAQKRTWKCSFGHEWKEGGKGKHPIAANGGGGKTSFICPYCLMEQIGVTVGTVEEEDE